MTPVTDTYNHIGRVTTAIFLCLLMSDAQPLYRLKRASGIMIVASIICDNKTK